MITLMQCTECSTEWVAFHESVTERLECPNCESLIQVPPEEDRVSLVYSNESGNKMLVALCGLIAAGFIAGCAFMAWLKSDDTRCRKFIDEFDPGPRL